MIILQISPEFAPGTGVGGVAWALEQQWLALGHDVRRFGPKEAGGALLSKRRPGLTGRVIHAVNVVWFSTVGTVRARRVMRRLPPDAVTICHNDALCGDIYVNHGLLQTAMRARGRYWWRMVRNPLHLFTAVRDYCRYRSATHQLVINLTEADDQAMRDLYPTLRPPTVVIGNGVDTEKFRPPTEGERRQARRDLGLVDGQILTLFVGHEFERKGLFPLLEAMGQVDERHRLVVLGGTPQMIEDVSARLPGFGMSDRCLLLGPADPVPYLRAADLLAQPSLYESYGLVVVEAMAAGVPVMSTAVGCAPELIREGQTGYITSGEASDMTRILQSHATADRTKMGKAAREAALAQTWRSVAERYLKVFSEQAKRVR